MKSLKNLADLKDELLKAEIAAWLHDCKKCTDEHVLSNARGGSGEGSSSKANAFLALLPLWKISLLEEEMTLQELIERRETSKWLVSALEECHRAAHTEKELVLFLFKQTANNVYKSTAFGYEDEKLAGLNELLDELSKYIQSFGNLIPNRNDIEQKIEETFSHACGDTRQPINDVTLWDWSRIVAALYKASLAEAVLKGQKNPEPTKWRLFSVRLDGLEFFGKGSRLPDLLARQKLIGDGLNKIRSLLEETYPLGTEIYRDENGSVFIVPDLDIRELKNESEENLLDLIQQAFSKGTLRDDPFLKLRSEILPFDKVDEDSWEWTNPYISVKTPQQIMDQHNKPMPIVAHIDREGSRLADPSIVDSWWQHHRADICTVCQLRPQGNIERKVCAICEQRRKGRATDWFDELYKTIWIDEVADIHGRVALIVGDFDLKQWLVGEFLFYPQKHWDEKNPTSENPPQFRQGAIRVKDLDNQPVNEVQFPNRKYTRQDKTGLLVTDQHDHSLAFTPPTQFRSKVLHINDPNINVIVRDVSLSPKGHYQIVLESKPPELVPGRAYSIQEQEFYLSNDGSYIETASDGAKELIKDKLLHFRSFKVEKSYILPILEPPPAQMVEAQAPTRMYRIWETTHAFWESVVSDFEKPALVSKVPGRLQIEGTFIPVAGAGSLGVSHTYELKLGNTNLSIVCKSPQIYLTVDNLRRTAKLLGLSEEKYKDATEEVKYREATKYLQELLKNGQFDVEEPTGYGSPNKPLGKLNITKADFHDTAYTPAISILTEPRTFMALVPADKALQVAKAIKDRYENEMGKVRNRLPLTVGVVFAGRRTPLPAILDAGRRILKQPTETAPWQVKKVNLGSYPEKVLLTLGQEQDESPTLILDIPAIMGDGITEDVWYPYWRLERETQNPVKRERLFKGIDGKDWVHISDLQEGDTVSFMPSRLDFEFLDTASRRFEVSYNDKGKRRGSVHPARPYYLEQLGEFEELWATLKEGLATSQIDNLVGLIETKRVEWLKYQDRDKSDFKEALETFEKVVEEIIRNAEWKKDYLTETRFNSLLPAAVSGLLADVFELHMTILKERGTE